MSNLLPFGIGAWTFIVLYVSSLLLVGWAGRAARREDTLQDFYLGGRGFGFAVLFLTLYATQYSGNTVFGVAGATYRLGFSWLIAVHYMLAIIVFYLAFAPKLYGVAQKRGYVTPVDYLKDRYDSKHVSLLGSIVMIEALNNNLLAQLMAMGRALQGLAGPYGDVAYRYGVVGLALIMLIYGTLGGMRAIAWTDVMQGSVLMGGFLVLLVLLLNEFGPLAAATEQIAGSAEAFKVTRPEPRMLREWVSYIIVIGMGGALYPHAIQRIYAAKSRRALNLSLSTADSAMLSISSMFTKDIYGVHINPEADESRLTKIGKRCSWIVVGVLVVLAIILENQASLIDLIDRKFDLLVQLVPAFMLGIHMPFLRGGPVLAGLLTGLTIALGLAFGPFDFVVAGKVWGVHPGVYGLVANTAVAVVGSLLQKPETRHGV